MVPRSRASAALVALLVLGGAALYSVNLPNPFVWEHNIIVANTDVHGLGARNVRNMFTRDLMAGSGTRSSYYRPLTSLSFAANYALDGLDPRGYHAVNNALHVAAAVLVYLLLASATASTGTAFTAAALFLIHPVQTEAVTYVAGRSDPLHLVFMLLALGAFWIAERRGAAWSAWPRPVSLALFACALLSHERAAVFPFLLAVFTFAFVTREGFWPALTLALRRSLAYFALLAGYAVARLALLERVQTFEFHSAPSLYTEHLHVRVFTFLHSLLVYYRLIFFPTGLHYKRSLEVHQSPLDWQVWLSLFVLVALTLALVALWRRGCPSRRIWLFGVGWLFVTLGPVSGITPINALIYEHWLYVGLIGPGTILGQHLVRAWRAAGARWSTAGQVGLAAAVLTYCGFLSAQTVRRNLIWGQPLEFYQDILRYEPDDISAHHHLGDVYHERGDLDRAAYHYERAAAGQSIVPHPHFGLGTIHQARGETAAAIASYERALEIDPQFHPALQGLIELHAKLGNFDAALTRIEQLKRVRPDDPHVFYNSALALQHVGQNERAVADARRAFELGADYPDPEVRRRAAQLLESLQR